MTLLYVQSILANTPSHTFTFQTLRANAIECIGMMGKVSVLKRVSAPPLHMGSCVNQLKPLAQSVSPLMPRL